MNLNHRRCASVTGFQAPLSNTVLGHKCGRNWQIDRMCYLYFDSIISYLSFVKS